jgi:DNA replication protein DnaC
MLLQQTHETLQQLRLKGMAEALEAQRTNSAVQGLSFEERFAMLVDAEYQTRETRRLSRLLKSAQLKAQACAEDIDYRAPRGLDRQLVASLLTCDWVEKSLNLIITGPTGVGKTWLGCAFGNQAARKGLSVLYRRMSRLLEELEIGRGDGSIAKLRAQIAKAHLLIIDDWALAPLTARGRQDLMELVDDRVGSGALLFTSQLPIDKWHDYIGEPTSADAILDRILHNAHRIQLRGESLRKQHALAVQTGS